MRCTMSLREHEQRTSPHRARVRLCVDCCLLMMLGLVHGTCAHVRANCPMMFYDKQWSLHRSPRSLLTVGSHWRGPCSYKTTAVQTLTVPGVLAVTQRNATRAPARPRTTSLTLSWTHGYSVCSFEWALVYPEESASFNGNACTHRKFDAHLDVERCPINLEH